MPDFEADNIINEAVAGYLSSLTGESPEPAKQMEQEARRRDFPIVGPQVGRLLELVASAVEPATIVELGSGFGYSAYWFGRSLDGVEIHLTDNDSDNLDQAREYLSGIEDRNDVRYHHGDALETFEAVEGPIDLVFVDIDKTDYPEALTRIEGRLQEGAWLIADNVLWKGKVADPEEDDESTEAIRRFNERLNGPAWSSSIIPIRDGLALARHQ